MDCNFVADSLTMCTYLHSFSRCWLPNLRNSERIRTYSRSRSCNVIALFISRKRIM